MITNKIFEDLVRTEYADVKVFSFLTGCTSSLLRSQDTVIWSYWQTPRIHAGKLCKVGMPIERISTGNICSREAQVPGGEVKFFCEWALQASRVKFRDMVDSLTLGIGDPEHISSAEGIRPACNRSIYCLVDLKTLESLHYLGCAQWARRLLLMFEVGEDLALSRPSPQNILNRIKLGCGVSAPAEPITSERGGHNIRRLQFVAFRNAQRNTAIP